MPGDIRYRDVDGNGTIDVNDAVHIGFPETPRMVYGFSGFINYKNWEFNFSFQGSGKRGFFINPKALSPFVEDHAMLKEIYESHWTEKNVDNRPFWPRLSVQDITVITSRKIGVRITRMIAVPPILCGSVVFYVARRWNWRITCHWDSAKNCGCRT